jgi:hypothetical protein
MDLIVKVLPPSLQTLPICTFYDNESDDEEVNENHSKEPWVVDMCRFMTSDDTSPNVEKKKDHNQPSSSSTPTKKMLVQMGDIMQEIINEVKECGFNS